MPSASATPIITGGARVIGFCVMRINLRSISPTALLDPRVRYRLMTHGARHRCTSPRAERNSVVRFIVRLFAKSRGCDDGGHRLRAVPACGPSCRRARALRQEPDLTATRCGARPGTHWFGTTIRPAGHALALPSMARRSRDHRPSPTATLEQSSPSRSASHRLSRRPVRRPDRAAIRRCLDEISRPSLSFWWWCRLSARNSQIILHARLTARIAGSRKSVPPSLGALEKHVCARRAIDRRSTARRCAIIMPNIMRRSTCCSRARVGSVILGRIELSSRARRAAADADLGACCRIGPATLRFRGCGSLIAPGLCLTVVRLRHQRVREMLALLLDRGMRGSR